MLENECLPFMSASVWVSGCRLKSGGLASRHYRLIFFKSENRNIPSLFAMRFPGTRSGVEGKKERKKEEYLMDVGKSREA